jgi:cytochrome c
VKRAWIVAVLATASVTGLGYVHPFGNPRVEPARGPGTLLQGANLPHGWRATGSHRLLQALNDGARFSQFVR